jgi:hypothetical protein
LPAKKLAIWPLVLAGAIFIAGIAAFVLVVATGLTDLGDSLKNRVAVPGKGSFVLEPGTYAVFHEHESDLDGTRTSARPGTPIACTIEGPDGEPVALAAATTPTEYSIGDRKGREEYRFEALKAGTYSLTATTTGPRTVLAVGKGVDRKLVTTTLVSFTIGFGSVALAFGIVAVTLLRWAFSKTA